MSSASGEVWVSGAPEPTVPSSRPTFHEIYDKWYEEVAKWVRAMGGPAADRDDLVQDVFVIVHRRLPDFDGKNLGGWLYQITRRRVRDFRRLAWFKRLLFRDAHALDRATSSALGPEGAMQVKDQQKLLDSLLMGLMEEQRVAFVLFEIEECSGEQIAEFQGVPLNTVWARIHTARKKLRERLNQLERAQRRRS